MFHIMTILPQKYAQKESSPSLPSLSVALILPQKSDKILFMMSCDKRGVHVSQSTNGYYEPSPGARFFAPSNPIYRFVNYEDGRTIEEGTVTEIRRLLVGFILSANFQKLIR